MVRLGRRVLGGSAVAGLVLVTAGCGTPDAVLVAAVATPSPVTSIAVAADLTGPRVGTAAGGSTAAGPGAPSEAATAMTGQNPAAATPDATCRRAEFAAHAGLGAAAVDRFVRQPFQQGAFAPGAQGRSTAIVEAALAGSFALREFTVALTDLQGCAGTDALAVAVRAGLARAGTLVGGLQSGSVDPAALAGVDRQLATVLDQARTAGITVAQPDLSAIRLAIGAGP